MNRQVGDLVLDEHGLARQGLSDAVFSDVADFLADDGGRFVAEVEKVEL